VALATTDVLAFALGGRAVWSQAAEAVTFGDTWRLQGSYGG